MFHDEKPSLEKTLKHFGVKGMHWGVIKKEETTNRSSNRQRKSVSDPQKAAIENALAKKYMAIKPIKRTKAEATKELAKNTEKFLAKADPSVAEGSIQKKGLSDKQKKLIKVGAGVAIVGGLVVASAYAHNKKIQGFKQLAGQPISPEKFVEGVNLSKFKTWGISGYIQDSSFARGEFTLPAGHEFHRVSTLPESSFRPGGVYATHNMEDFNRYVHAFRGEKASSKFYHVTFSTTKDLKVPSLATTLETMREVLSEEMKTEVTPEHAKTVYESYSGGSWDDSRRITKFFSALSSKGYGAIIDEMDAGVIGDSPLVVFAKHMTEKISVPLTDDAIKTAEQSLIELANRKL